MSASVLHRSRKHGITARRRMARSRRHFRLRKKVQGTPERPRMVVTRSLRHIYVQIVDDNAGHTLVSASTMDSSLREDSGTKSDQATKVGALVAERAKQAGIASVVFDRGGNAYYGRIAKLADAAREGGIEF